MKEKLTGFWDGVKAFWERTSKKMRILYLSVLAGILLISLAVVMILNHTDYVVLSESLTLTESAEVMALLQEMGVENKLENNRIMIPQKDEMYVRMQLATKGYTNTGFAYETFSKGSGLTQTQFEKNFYANADLQDRLAATIKTFPEVQDAIVNLSMPQTSNYVLQEDIQPPTAAIKITKRPGRELTAEQIRGILNIVKNSVPGLTENNISLADEAGDLMGKMGYGQTVSDQKLALTEQINETVRRRVIELIGPRYGAGKFTVAVNTVLDTDAKTTDTTTYHPKDPENPANNPLDYAEHLAEGSGGDPVVRGVPGANDNVDVPEYAAQLTEDEQNGYYSRHDIYDYLVDSERVVVEKTGLHIQEMSVSVLIDKENMPEVERDTLIALVSTAAGINPERVTVQNLSFLDVGEVTVPPESRLRQVLIVSGILLLLLIVVVVLVLMYLARRRKEREAADAYEAEQATLVEMLAHQNEDFEPITLIETQEQKLRSQIRDLADTDPEIVAQLIKTWLFND